MNRKMHFVRPTFLSNLPFILVLICAFASGCASLSTIPQPPSHRSLSDLHVITSQGSSIHFQEGSWQLTLSGITGKAEVTENASIRFVDTTLAYQQVASAESTKEDPWTKLLLTILGVLIVIGLAGVVLYAAFRATER